MLQDGTDRDNDQDRFWTTIVQVYYDNSENPAEAESSQPPPGKESGFSSSNVFYNHETYLQHLDSQIDSLQTLLGHYLETKASTKKFLDAFEDAVLIEQDRKHEETVIDKLLQLYTKEKAVTTSASTQVKVDLQVSDIEQYALPSSDIFSFNPSTFNPSSFDYIGYTPAHLKPSFPHKPSDPLSTRGPSFEPSLTQLDVYSEQGYIMDPVVAERMWILIVGILFGVVIGGATLLYLIRRIIRKSKSDNDTSMDKEQGSAESQEAFQKLSASTGCIPELLKATMDPESIFGKSASSESRPVSDKDSAYGNPIYEETELQNRNVRDCTVNETTEPAGDSSSSQEIPSGFPEPASIGIEEEQIGESEEADRQESSAKVSSTVEVESKSMAVEESEASNGSSKDSFPLSPTVSESVSIATSTTRNWEVDYSEIEITGRIGIGAFGECLKGDWRGTPVAVKRLWYVTDRTNAGGDPGDEAEVDLPKPKDEGDAPGELQEVLQDIEREIGILASLRHPNVVLFMGACRVPPDVCIVMELCNRGSLDRVLYVPHLQQHLDPKRRLRMALQISRGMNFLHTLNPPIIHRDMKPGNLLVTQNFDIKVCDFGISLYHNKTVATATCKIGTAQYAAPEMLESDSYTQKIDVWSFGVILWELIAKQRPYAHLTSIYQVINAVVVHKEKLKPLTSLSKPAVDWADSPGVLEGIQSIMEECTIWEAESRPAFSDVQVRLDTLTSQKETQKQGRPQRTGTA